MQEIKSKLVKTKKSTSIKEGTANTRKDSSEHLHSNLVKKKITNLQNL